MDTAKAGQYVGCYSRVLVIVGPCRRFRDLSAASVPQPWGHILKKDAVYNEAQSNYADAACDYVKLGDKEAAFAALEKTLVDHKQLVRQSPVWPTTITAPDPR